MSICNISWKQACSPVINWQLVSASTPRQLGLAPTPWPWVLEKKWQTMDGWMEDMMSIKMYFCWCEWTVNAHPEMSRNMLESDRNEVTMVTCLFRLQLCVTYKTHKTMTHIVADQCSHTGTHLSLYWTQNVSSSDRIALKLGVTPKGNFFEEAPASKAIFISLLNEI